MEKDRTHHQHECEKPRTQTEILSHQMEQELDDMFGEGYTASLRKNDPIEYMREWVWFLKEHDPAEVELKYRGNYGVPKSAIYDL